MNLTLYLIDDEFHALEVLQAYIEQTPGLRLGGRSTQPLLALQEINSGLPIDAVLLDIDMPELSGLHLAELLPPEMPVVFTTSFREYAVEAFDRRALDYLLKPIAYERFLKCMQRITEHLKLSSLPFATAPSIFYVKSEHKGKWVQIRMADLVYLEALQHYVQLNLTTGKVVTYLQLNELAERLPAGAFSRVHKSFIVHHDYIQSVEAHQLRLTTQVVIPIGRAFLPPFQQKLQQQAWISKREQER